LSNIPWVLYALGLLSSINVLLVLGIIYAVVYMLIFKTENSYRSIKELWVSMAFGLTVAVLQIAVMDLGRLWLTGTWNGFFANVQFIFLRRFL
jgi:hypothetical protein